MGKGKRRIWLCGGLRLCGGKGKVVEVVQSPDDNQGTCGWVAIWWRRGRWLLPVCGGVRWAGAVVRLWRLAGRLPPSRIFIDASNPQKVSLSTLSDDEIAQMLGLPNRQKILNLRHNVSKPLNAGRWRNSDGKPRVLAN